MASPLRFRRSEDIWSEERVRRDLLEPLEDSIGAEMSRPTFEPGREYEARRFDMDNGDIALFAWNSRGGYWIGNTETPSTLWRTHKISIEESPDVISRWVELELLDELDSSAPWLTQYPKLAWFFLPVFLSKDGRETSREFFRDYAAGFPNATMDEALSFYNDFLDTGVFDDYRYTMSSKLGTSNQLDLVRMRSAMSEFSVGKILFDAGYDVTPEIEVETGHRLDFRAEKEDESFLVEVTRPQPPRERSSGTALEAVRDTAETKANGQLESYEDAVLFIDCSSFSEEEWRKVKSEKPNVPHHPCVVFRVSPSKEQVKGYMKTKKTKSEDQESREQDREREEVQKPEELDAVLGE